MLLALVNFASTQVMTGVIWTIQVVHYPLMGKVPAPAFVAYHRAHMRLISWVVLPTMVVELATSAALVAWRPSAMSAGVAWTGLAMAAGLWASTFLLQVPCHGRLARGFDPAAHRRLVATNWVRTALWTARAGLMFGCVAAAAGA